MRRFLAGILIVVALAAANLSFGAAGDKTPVTSTKFRNVSSSIKPQSTSPGEIRYNQSYLFLNISGTGTHTHWRRISTGASF